MATHATASGITITDFRDSDEWTELPFGLRQTVLHVGGAEPSNPILVMTSFPPDRILPRHSHPAPFCDAVVAGSMWVEDDERWYPAGTVRYVPSGTVYGPTRSGPDGLTLLEFYATFEGFPADMVWDSMTDDQLAEIERYRAERAPS
jgi:hypothetical protein